MELYEKLWQDAVTALMRGEPQLDAHLLNRAGDMRRGVTIVLRPSPAVCGRVKAYIDRLAAVCPGQHFYRPEELHVTVLSIISGTEYWQKEILKLPAYRAVIRDVLSKQRPFKLDFKGITATPNSVMIQGFPAGNGLALVRDELRSAFARAGYSGLLDRRYKISAAHMTIMRFCRPETDWKRLLALLEEGRKLDFGMMEVDCLQLIQADWYASTDTLQILDEHRLA